MSIVVSRKSGLTKILIEGSLPLKDMESFLKETRDDESSYEISFINIMVIPLRVIKRIYDIKSRTKLFTNERALRHYLGDFNIEVVCQESSLPAKNPSRIDYIAIGGR